MKNIDLKLARTLSIIHVMGMVLILSMVSCAEGTQRVQDTPERPSQSQMIPVQ